MSDYTPLEQFLYDTGLCRPGEVKLWAREIERSDWLRDHDAKVRAEQREEDAQIVESEFVRRSYSVKADAAAAIRAVPANTNTDPELSDSERGN